MAENSGSPKIRVPSPVLRWLIEQQRPRETIGETLQRILERQMKRSAKNGASDTNG